MRSIDRFVIEECDLNGGFLRPTWDQKNLFIHTILHLYKKYQIWSQTLGCLNSHAKDRRSGSGMGGGVELAIPGLIV